MSASTHDAYVPGYMMKQSLWNMEQQVSQLQGMITPQTRLMAWQPHLVSQAQRDIQNVYNSMAYNRHVHGGKGYGAMYGGCGSCGTAACGSGEYGGGCGTFLRLFVRDPAKKACLLEKDIAKHKKCCEQGCFLKSKSNQCRKMAEKQAELEAIHMAEYGPLDYSTATDMQAQLYQEQVDQQAADLELQQAQTTRMLIIAGGGAVLLLLGVLAVR